MKPDSSSTSSSDVGENPATRWKRRRRDLLGVALGFVVILVALDVATGWVTAMPSDPHQQPTWLQRYMDYGRSVEGKLRRDIGSTDAVTGPIHLAGWWSRGLDNPMIAADGEDSVLVAAYGMSFTGNVMGAARDIDPRVQVRSMLGPASPLNHSITVYRADRSRHRASVVVMGVLASSFPAIDSMSHMTWNPEAPAAYTYPRYLLENGSIRRIDPVVGSLDELRQYLADPAAMERYWESLEQYDAFYDPWIARVTWLDYSVLGRVVRRSYGQRHIAAIRERYLLPDGSFSPQVNASQVAPRLIVDFARTAREDGRLPIVLIFNDFGYGQALYKLLAPTLSEQQIDFVSSHTIADPADPTNFLPDSHFKPEIDRQMALQLLKIIDKKHWAHLDRRH